VLATPRLTHAAVSRTEKGFDSRPRWAVGQRPEAEGPPVGQLLSDGGVEARVLKVSSLRLGSLKARGTVVRAIDAVAATFDRPNRHPIGREERSCDENLKRSHNSRRRSMTAVAAELSVT
jgi:hypothetical protein